MYWQQLINYHRDLRCGGAPAYKVIESLAKARGISEREAAQEVEMAVLIKDLVYVKCECK